MGFQPDTPLLIKIVKGLMFLRLVGRLHTDSMPRMGIALGRVHPYFLEVLRRSLMDALRQSSPF